LTALVEEQGLTRLLELREVDHSTKWAHGARENGVRGERSDDVW
jgi:hypothetical protein